MGRGVKLECQLRKNDQKRLPGPGERREICDISSRREMALPKLGRTWRGGGSGEGKRAFRSKTTYLTFAKKPN